VAVVAYLTCAPVWSTTWFAIRVCIGTGGYPTFISAALRFTLASVLLGVALLAGVGHPRPSRREALWIGLAGLINAAGYALVYRAEQEVAGGLAAVLYGTMPLMTGFIAAATHTERLRASTAAGAVVGLAGIVVIFWDRLSVSAEQALGVALVLVSVACASSYSVLLKRKAAAVNPFASTAVFFPGTAAGLWLLTLVAERRAPPWPPPAAPTLALLYLTVMGSVVTFAAYFYLVGKVRLATVSTLALVEPVFALVVDALFEHQARPRPTTYVGAAITVSGVLVSILLGRREPAAAAAAVAPSGTPRRARTGT